MTKELKAQLDVLDSYINDIPNIFEVCRLCEFIDKEELEKEASKYALEWGDKTDGTYACCRDGYLAGAEPRERRIVKLEKENAELKKKLKPENCLKLLEKEGYVMFSSVQLDKAKDLIRNLLRVTYGEGWNYSLDWKVKAEKFLEKTE